MDRSQADSIAQIAQKLAIIGDDLDQKYLKKINVFNQICTFLEKIHAGNYL